MKLIKLTKSKYAKVDDQDYEFLNQFKWHTVVKGTNLYAAKGITVGYRKYSTLYMHNLLMCPPSGYEVDHKNRNGLDNRKDNLRYASRSQNNQNKKMRHIYKGKPTSSRFKGVFYDNKCKNKNWKAQIIYNKKIIRLGRFDTEIEAAKAYNKKAKELFGEFAFYNDTNDPNFVNDGSRCKHVV